MGARAGNQGRRLRASDSRVRNQQLAPARHVHPINAERRIAPASWRSIPPKGRISHQAFLAAQRIWVLPEFPLLPVGIDALGRRLADWGDELDAAVPLAAPGGVNDRQFARLRRMVAAQDGQDLLRAGDAPRMGDGGREPAIVSVKCGLPGAVRIHLKEGLGENLAPVIVIPSGINHAAIIQDLGIEGVDLVKAEAAQESALRVAGVEIADLRPPAIHRLHATRRSKHDVVVRQVRRLVVRKAQARSNLRNLVGRYVQFVEVIVILVERLLPRE